MRLIIYTLPLILLSIFTTYMISKRIHARKIELDEMNTLYFCDSCGKFHQRYQEELQLLIDPKYKSYLTCPNCYSETKIFTDEEYTWMKTNPECPELDKHDLKKIKTAMKKTKKIILEDKSIDQFLHYYKLNETKEEKF